MSRTGAANETFGISAQTLRQLHELFDRTPRLERVWIFGSRATGKARINSDIDLVFEAPEMSAAAARDLALAIADLPTLYAIDALHWQRVADPELRLEIERDRKLLWKASGARVEDRADGAEAAA